MRDDLAAMLGVTLVLCGALVVIGLGIYITLSLVF